MLPVWDRWALSFAILPLQGELLATGFWLLAVSLGLLRAEFCNSAATGGATGFWLLATFGWYLRRCSNRERLRVESCKSAATGLLVATGLWLSTGFGLMGTEFCNSAATGGATGFWLLAVSLEVLRAEFCNSAATGMVLAASFSLLGPCFGVLGTEFCKFAATEVWSEPTK